MFVNGRSGTYDNRPGSNVIEDHAIGLPCGGGLSAEGA